MVKLKLNDVLMTLIKYLRYVWSVILQLFVIRSMKRKKLYLSFFYGSQQELTKAFNKITNGDYVRYIMTAETLICRFRSAKKIDEILAILRQHCPDVPFFVFPITTPNWVYNLPLDVENNLLTDNPIIQTPQNQVINQYLMPIVSELTQRLPGIVDEQIPDFVNLAIDHFNIRLKEAIAEDNFELAAQIRDKIKELTNIKNDQNDKRITTIE